MPASKCLPVLWSHGNKQLLSCLTTPHFYQAFFSSSVFCFVLLSFLSIPPLLSSHHGVLAFSTTFYLPRLSICFILYSFIGPARTCHHLSSNLWHLTAGQIWPVIPSKRWWWGRLLHLVPYDKTQEEATKVTGKIRMNYYAPFTNKPGLLVFCVSGSQNPKWNGLEFLMIGFWLLGCFGASGWLSCQKHDDNINAKRA